MEALRELLASLGLLQPLIGGLLIGLAAALLWLFDGRVAGISGISGGLFEAPRGDRRWRLMFVLGLLVGGAVMWRVLPEAFGLGDAGGDAAAIAANSGSGGTESKGATSAASGAAGVGSGGGGAAGVGSVLGSGTLALLLAVAAGLLVGVGTSLSRGCTSGHGVCGISRLSRRSIIATGTFMATGAITALVAGRLLAALGGGGAS